MKKFLLLAIMIVGAAIWQISAQEVATGFAISEKYVLTSYDAIGSERTVQLKFGDDSWIKADYVDGNQDEGWCVLELQGKAPAFVTIEAEQEVESSDEVYVYSVDNSDSSQGRINYFDGEVENVEKDLRCGSVIIHTVKLSNSAIGAALFSEENNHVIGLIVGESGELWRISQKAISLNEKLSKIQQYTEKQDKVTRRMNRKAICIIQSKVVGVFNNINNRRRRSRLNSNTTNDTNTDTYKKSKNAVAIVEGNESQGTGFLCEMDGKKYFVTNRHVARQRGRLTASFLDGKKIEFSLESIVDVAENRDLVRFEITEELNRPFLKISNTPPNIGDRVEFYGNAGGGKVITVTTGKILAVGQERIEIDTPIQGGNSGSPLIQISDGAVIGVTTLSTFNRISGDPSKVGTRYDPNVKLTREFSDRFSGVMWNSVPYGRFLKSVNVYRDLCDFYLLMDKVCIADRQVGVYNYRLPDLKFRGATQLNAYVRKIAKSDELEKKAWDRIVMMRERNQQEGSITRYGQLECEHAVKSLKEKVTKAYVTRKEVLYSVLNYCKSITVLSNKEKNEAIEAFDKQYRIYCEKYRRQLSGVFSDIDDY